MDAEEWIGLDQPGRWAAALQGVPHSYWHTYEACRVASVNTGFPVFLYVWHGQNGRVVCPLMEREWHGSRDLTTPIGFSGLATSTGALPEKFPESWVAALRNRLILAVYLAQHPLFAPVWPGRGETDGGTLYFIDLHEPPEQWLRRADRNRWRSIRAWDRAQSEWVRDRPALTDFAVEHHSGFMRSVRASSASYFTEEALLLLCSNPQVELVGARDSQGICTVAAFGATRWGSELLFHISVRGGRAFTAALMWWGVQNYHGRVSTINLGGTPQENDALAAAKRRYRPREVALRKLKLVVDPPKYAALCAESGVDADDLSGYFPAYRQPSMTRLSPL